MIFDHIFETFRREEPHKELEELYFSIFSLSQDLIKLLGELRELAKTVHKQAFKGKVEKGSTGSLALAKSQYIDNELIPQMTKLRQHARKRWDAVQKIASHQPVSEIEKKGLVEIESFLKEIGSLVGDLSHGGYLPLKGKNYDRLISDLREVSETAAEFDRIREVAQHTLQTLRTHQISPLLRAAYENYKTDSHDRKYFELRHGQLSDFIEEAKKINNAKDPDYSIKFRNRGGNIVPEKDPTGLNMPHVDVTMKLGGPKVNIHLIVQ